MLTISIDRDLGDAVYAQVAGQIRRLVVSGVLPPGTPIPPVRQLARDLGVSLNTVARAYRLLEAEGFLEIRDRSGAVVAPPATRVDQAATSELIEELRTVLARLRQAGMGPDELRSLVEHEAAALDSAARGG